jgi:hypothetical protein
MQHLKSFLALVALASFMSAMAAQTTTTQNSFTTTTTTTTTAPTSPQTFPTYDAPTGASTNTGISDASPSTSTSSSTTGINNNWANATGVEIKATGVDVFTGATSSSATNTPLISTVPQFNIMDVKVTASGGCEVKKNGTVIMTGGSVGSPCQKLYGKGIQQASSGTAGTLPLEYQPSNLDAPFHHSNMATE